MRKKDNKNETNDINMEHMMDIINKMIKDKKIIFSFYNSVIPLEFLQICFNKKENIIELKFRDIQQEHIEELKELSK